METTRIGVPQHIASATCYVLTWLSGFFWLIAERRDELVRYHGALSVLVFVPLQVVLGVLYVIVLYVAPSTGVGRIVIYSVYGLVALAALGLWGWLIVSGYRLRKPEIPVATNLANRIVEATNVEDDLK